MKCLTITSLICLMLNLLVIHVKRVTLQQRNMILLAYLRKNMINEDKFHNVNKNY